MDLIEEKNIVVKNMTKYGGGFVKSLGQTLMKADGVNTKKIKMVFGGYWQEYLNWENENKVRINITNT